MKGYLFCRKIFYPCSRHTEASNKELEAFRQAGKLGAPLEASVSLYCEPALKEKLDALHNELRFVLITSSASVHAFDSEGIATDIPGLNVKIEALAVAKCERCWDRRADVGQNPGFSTLCVRCVENVSGEGEVRLYA